MTEECVANGWHARWLRHRSAFGLLALGVVLIAGPLCRTYADFWFEDDAPHRVFVRDHANPLAYFGPELVAELSLGHSVTPWFPLTFWVDRQVSAMSPMPAYLHSALSLWLAACAFYLLMARFLARPYALVTALLWLLLPSTVVAIEFLSTRHYLEGFLFSLVAVYAGLKAVECPGQRGRRALALSLAAYLLACTTKEVYVSATFVALFCLFLDRRRWPALGLLIGCGVAYAAYRLVSLPSAAKASGAAFAAHYHLFLARWPYMFSGHEGGYLLLVAAVVVLGLVLYKRRLGWRALVYGGGLGAVMLLTIFPVSEHITDAYRELGTWYRVIFLFNGFALFAGAYLVARLRLRWLAQALAVVTALSLMLGAWRTSRNWDASKAKHTLEARFYIDHPDRLLYSNLPAFWYLYGIHHLYQPELEPHYITYRDLAECERLTRYQTVWTRGERGIKAFPELLERLRANCRDQVQPLHQGWAPPP